MEKIASFRKTTALFQYIHFITHQVVICMCEFLTAQKNLAQMINLRYFDN